MSVFKQTLSTKLTLTFILFSFFLVSVGCSIGRSIAQADPASQTEKVKFWVKKLMQEELAKLDVHNPINLETLQRDPNPQEEHVRLSLAYGFPGLIYTNVKGFEAAKKGLPKWGTFAFEETIIHVGEHAIPCLTLVIFSADVSQKAGRSQEYREHYVCASLPETAPEGQKPVLKVDKTPTKPEVQKAQEPDKPKKPRKHKFFPRTG